MQKKGSAFLVTDDPDYSTRMIHEMQNSSLWVSAFSEPYYVLEWPEYGSSFFDTLWRSKGCSIRYHLFTRANHESV